MEGDSNALGFFGDHLFSGGKYLAITEGEIDCLSVSQVFGNKYPVVSLPHGVGSAQKAVKNRWDWLLGFDTIVLMFDMDERGREAATTVADMLPPGRVKIASFPAPYKDANEALLAGAADVIIRAFWDAKPFRPDGIVSISDIKEDLFKPVQEGAPWPWSELTRLTYGRRLGELYLFGAGVGVGKTDLFTECMAYDIATLSEPVGAIFLEQPVAETVQRVAGKLESKLFHIPGESWTPDEYREAIERLEKANRLWLFNHFGAKDWDTISGRIRYFSKALGIRHIYLDHLTALVANAEDERRALDGLMADMASLAQDCGLVLHVISHLTTPDGRPHEEGGRVMEKHFTGSRAIARWAHYMIGLERNKQAEDEQERSTMTIRVLKDRYTGRASGCTFPLTYNKHTGRLTEAVF